MTAGVPRYKSSSPYWPSIGAPIAKTAFSLRKMACEILIKAEATP